jgi:hypothetical protein
MSASHSVVALVVAALLTGCGPAATIENRTGAPIHDVRWVLKEDPNVVIEAGSIDAYSSRRTKLPGFFGESSLWVEARRIDDALGTECGYIEASSMYVAKASISSEGGIACEVSINGY